MYLKLLSILMLFLCGSAVFAKHEHPEKFYQNNWCSENKGTLEYRLPDSTRIDCVTDNYAIEFDFAHKWAEAVGQSLHYGLMTGKEPAIVLIMEKKTDGKYYDRVKRLCDTYKIKLFTIP